MRKMAVEDGSKPVVVVVGAGVVGCCVARELSRYEVQTVVLEAGDDLACGATRANSGIVHAGFDPVPGTNKAHYNALGSALYPQWAEELGFAFRRNGSMVAAFSDDELSGLDELLERGHANGIKGLRIVSHDEALELEPNLSPEVRGALVAETGGICNPYGVAYGAAENAAANGAIFLFDENVVSIEKPAAEGQRYRVVAESGLSIGADAVVNAAGIHSDELNNMVSESKLCITPVRGDYILYEPAMGALFDHTMFQVPGPSGKGVLVSPTVHGNLFVGPDAMPQDSKDSLGTEREGLDYIVDRARRTWPGASTRGQITNFAGLRASGESRDFVVGEVEDAPCFFNAACIDSPGLTAAPAIAQDIADKIAGILNARESKSFSPTRRPSRLLAMMDAEGVKEAIASNPAWGNIVCNCCKVSEGEIVAALHGPLPVRSLDALKWRCGAMMGECHGGFCTPKILRIVCRELGCRPEEVDKRLRGSWMVSSSREDYVDLAKSETGVWPEVPEKIDSEYDVVVVGAGAAGMAAAKAAAREGAHVLIADRGTRIGGILCQCVHSGFGLQRYSEELTGPEYAEREGADLSTLGIDVMEGASVLFVDRGGEGDQWRFAVGIAAPSGFVRVACRALVLATGSRERGFGALNVAGDRPSGIYTAGSAQTLINLQGCLPGKRAVVLGSGDIGLIMARRMTLEGMEVLGVHEIMPHPSGLRRNIVQCLDDFGIPLTLSSTVVRVEGSRRLEAVWVSSVDPKTLAPIPGTEKRIECDTLVLSVGLIPENHLAEELGIEMDPSTKGPRVDGSFQTSIPGVFSCGNSLHIHDLADWASSEGDAAGAAAARWALEDAVSAADAALVPIIAGEGVGHVVPQRLSVAETEAALEFRVSQVIENAVFEAVGVKDGVEEVLKKGRARIAVPAEMARLALSGIDASRYDAIEVRAHVK